MTPSVRSISSELRQRLSEPDASPAAEPTVVPDGIYHRGDVEYFRVRAVNFSSLKFIDRSPLHYRHRQRTPMKETGLMRLGQANHVAILEPEKFAEDFVVWETEWAEHHFEGGRDGAKWDKFVREKLGNKRVRNGSAWKSFRDEHRHKTIITDAEYAQALAFRDAVRSNADLMPLLAVGRPEVTIIWTDDEFGLTLKGRVDWAGTILGGKPEYAGRAHIADIKGTDDVDERMFGRKCARLLYHAQQAMYHDGWLRVTGTAPVVGIAAVEMSPPHDSIPYVFSDDELDEGRRIYKGWLAKLAECKETNDWHGQGRGGIRVLRLPWYAGREDDAELTSGGKTLGV